MSTESLFTVNDLRKKDLFLPPPPPHQLGPATPNCSIPVFRLTYQAEGSWVCLPSHEYLTSCEINTSQGALTRKYSEATEVVPSPLYLAEPTNCTRCLFRLRPHGLKRGMDFLNLCRNSVPHILISHPNLVDLTLFPS